MCTCCVLFLFFAVFSQQLSYFSQHQLASLPTLWSFCWTLELIHPSKTWRALSLRKSLNPVPSPPSCVSTRLRKARSPTCHHPGPTPALVSLFIPSRIKKVLFELISKYLRWVWFCWLGTLEVQDVKMSPSTWLDTWNEAHRMYFHSSKYCMLTLYAY